MAHNPYEREFLDKLGDLHPTVLLSKLTVDTTLQIRASLDEDIITEYCELYKAGVPLPPIIIWDDGVLLRVVDGFIRVDAAKLAGLDRLSMKVIRGTFTEAFLYACDTNLKNGKKITREDKRKIVIAMLKNPELKSWGARGIARRCQVSNTFVSNIVKEVCIEQNVIEGDLHLSTLTDETKTTANSTPLESRIKATRNGKDYFINVANIGKSTKEDPPKKDFEAANDDKAEEHEADEAEEDHICDKCFETKTELSETKDGDLFCSDCLKESGEERALKNEAFARKKAENRAITIAKIAKSGVPTPGKPGPFHLLYCDPPWRYDARISKSRCIENHYPTMSLEELCSLDISSICAPSAVLYLWVTVPMNCAAMSLLNAWGFEYKCTAVWEKIGGSPGLGFWWRIETEFLVVATRGKVPPPINKNLISNILRYPRTKHSAKPPEVRALLERFYPELKKVELFAREKVEGWEAIGNEIDGRDIRDVVGTI